jgi:cytochrome P450
MTLFNLFVRVGYENAVTLAQYDSLHKERRKMIHEAFSSRKLSRYHEYEEQRVRKFAADLLHDPPNFLHHIAVYVRFQFSLGREYVDLMIV